MKNVIKKISAFAMAFTLLGTGSAISKSITPMSENTLITHASGGQESCMHDSVRIDTGWVTLEYGYKYRTIRDYCPHCNFIFYTHTDSILGYGSYVPY
ncbi:hypothetical protein [Ruminococcus sp.]|uniref:hypothetical protein n=1 Tax=Ruminococcus sp. TaxID=41978 RepID=UPI0025FE7ACD|nr:hypothetical protein [Ruminococcus sp.]